MHIADFRSDTRFDADVAVPRKPADDRCDVADDLRESHPLRLQINFSRFHFGEIENVVDQLKQMTRALQDERAELRVLDRQGPEPLVRHDLGEPDD